MADKALGMCTTGMLLDTFVWGREPEGITDITKELEKRGVDLRQLIDAVDEAISRVLWKVEK